MRPEERMMRRALAFFEPHSVAEAVALLVEHGAGAKVVAGSTALTIMLRHRLIDPTALVSLARVSGLATIAEDDGAVVLGSLVTHREVEQSELVRRRIPVLAETFASVANVRVRNAATVGGVVAEADYASDPPAVLVALDAVVEAHGPGGVRRIPADEFFLGFYQTSLLPDEVVTSVRVPIPAPGTSAAYEKFVTRSSEDRPCVGVAAVVRLQGELCADLRIVVGAASETPKRYRDLESRGLRTTLATETVAGIAAGYADQIETLADMRGSSEYRKAIIQVLIGRAVLRALASTERSRS